MDSDSLNAFAASMSAVAALAALMVAWLSLRESRRASEAAQRQRAHAMDATLQARLDPMYPELRRVLGELDDGVPQEIRQALIPFYVLFSDAFAAHRDGLLDERDWSGFRDELAYWAQKPVARRAWRAFRQQTWTEGFTLYVDEILAGPGAYPALEERATAAGLDWPDEPNGEPGSARTP